MSIRLSTALFALLFGLLSISSGIAAGAKQDDKLDEIDIVGKRPGLMGMRIEIMQLESKIFDEFNKLNTNRRFDMVCDGPGYRGDCRPRMIRKWKHEKFVAELEGFSTDSIDRRMFEESVEFNQFALKFINSNPSLLKLVRAREAAERRYRKARNEKWDGKWYFSN
jgi:hypothetical protein